MSIATKPNQESQQRALRRIWKAPASGSRWLWLSASIAIFTAILVWFLMAKQSQPHIEAIDDPLKLFGIFAYILVIGTATYTLRRRFARGLPGKVQNWLWMHTWLGIVTILIALLHENFVRITHDFCQNLTCLTDTYFATSALFALIFLIVSGIFGRILDTWQTRVIAQDASTNGVGIVGALQERILELEYVVERLSAGKSEPFKGFCLKAIQDGANFNPTSKDVPVILRTEGEDFTSAYETLKKRAQLVRSLHRQQRARTIIRVWRTAHILLATLSLLVISYHGVMELLSNVFHIIPPA